MTLGDLQFKAIQEKRIISRKLNIEYIVQCSQLQEN